jgi:alkanesulfonate monooxygenase SsuD/methylene tetrahydromethanopterin reductase-like flavin-dependent oxidoreductase (luciferase family)
VKFYLFLPGQWWDRSKPPAQLYGEMLDQAQFADELGYDGIWLAEQNLVSFLAAPDPLQLAAAIADRTERIRIGIGVFVLPFHHPLRLAGQIAQIDQVSGGRFDVAAGRGASPYQMRQFGIEMAEDESRAFFAEHLEVMVRHWTEPGAPDGDGRFFKYSGATVLPPPVQRPHPPLWIATSPKSMRWALKLGVDGNVLYPAFRKPFSHVVEAYELFEDALREANRERSTTAFALNRMTYVAEDRDEAWDAMRYVVMNHRVVDQQYDDVERLADGSYVVDKRIRDDEPEVTEMFENLSYGTVDEVREKIRRYADLGIDVYSAWQNIGQDHDRVMRSLELFAREIMPEFQARSSPARP